MQLSKKILFVFFLFSCLVKAQEEITPLPYLNDLRHMSGMITFESNPALQKAAKAHADYLIIQQRNTHFETRSHKGFTGETPSDRVIKHGYVSQDVMENISINSKNSIESVENLFSAIYHRFILLNFDKDEIGIGQAHTSRKRAIMRSTVYDFGSSKLDHLCKKNFSLHNGERYFKNVCANSQNPIPQSTYQNSKDKIRKKNAKAVCYPYNGQKRVLPVFYNESPDPLPGYKVSGYPVSVQFNPLFFGDKNIKMNSFKLYDAEGRVLEKTRILTWENDPNRRFKKGQFALMPLKRLEYGMTYTAVFEARVDGEKYTKKWSFTTKSFKDKLYRITKKNETLDVDPNSTVILYFVPTSRNDLFRHYTYRGGLKVSFIDQNTLKVTLPNKLRKKTMIQAGKNVVKFF